MSNQINEQTGQPEKKAIFQVSPDTIVVAKRLKMLAPGEMMPREEGKTLVPGRDLFGKHRYILASAIRKLQREDEIVIESVMGEGVKRIVNEEIPSIGTAAIEAIGRKAKRASLKVLCADYVKLSAGAKVQYNTNLSMLGAIRQFTKPKVVKDVSEHVKAASTPISIEDVVNISQFKK